MSLIIDLESIPSSKTEEIFSKEEILKYLPVAVGKIKDEIEQQETMRKLYGLDPDFSEIFCIGVVSIDSHKGIVKRRIICPEIELSNEKGFQIINNQIFIEGEKKEDIIIGNREKWILEEFWKFVSKYEPGFNTITFNGINFDLPFIFKKSLYHGIIPPVQPGALTLRKYTHFPHFDLMQALSYWGSLKFKSLKFYSKLFSLKIKDEIESETIYELWKNKEYEKIINHCETDTNLTFQLFKKIHFFFGVGY